MYIVTDLECSSIMPSQCKSISTLGALHDPEWFPFLTRIVSETLLRLWPITVSNLRQTSPDEPVRSVGSTTIPAIVSSLVRFSFTFTASKVHHNSIRRYQFSTRCISSAIKQRSTKCRENFCQLLLGQLAPPLSANTEHTQTKWKKKKTKKKIK